MWKEFKEFAVKGNVIDLAVAVVIGTAFGKIVSSLVDNIIMPLVGILTGGIDFTQSFIWQVGEASVALACFSKVSLTSLLFPFPFSSLLES